MKKKSEYLCWWDTNLRYSQLHTVNPYAFITIIAKEGHFILGTTYAASRIDFEEILEE